MKVSLKVESLTSAEIHKKSMEINEILQKGVSQKKRLLHLKQLEKLNFG